MSEMKMTIELRDPEVWYRKSTKEWIVDVNILTPNCSQCIRFSNKKRSKALKSFYKYCTSGLLDMEMIYLFEHKEIHFKT